MSAIGPTKEYNFADPSTQMERAFQARLRGVLNAARAAGVSESAIISMLKIELPRSELAKPTPNGFTHLLDVDVPVPEEA